MRLAPNIWRLVIDIIAIVGSQIGRNSLRNVQAATIVALTVFQVQVAHSASMFGGGICVATTVTRSGNTKKFLTRQVVQVNQIAEEASALNRFQREDFQKVSQARVDALLLKNSIANMADALDRYRRFFADSHRR
jgi:hypothetical protein